MGRVARDLMLQDAVVPRSRLPEVLADIYRIGAHYSLRLANVFHAGDGNLHPLICFDLRDKDEVRRVEAASKEIVRTCVEAGGSITGEHGVGLDKRAYLPLIFSDDDLATMLRVRAAFDPSGLCNPGKIIPAPRGCGEARAIATQSVSERGVVSPLPLGEGQGEGLRRRNFVSHPDPLPGGEGVLRATKGARLAERISEARVANEFKRIVGAPNLNRLFDTELS